MPLARKSRREGAVGRPASQETRPRPQSQQPSRKGVALMKKAALVLASTLALAGGAITPAAIGSGVAGRTARAIGPTVKVQIKTPTKTLLGPTRVRGRTGWITKGGTPRGKCSARSAAGALNVATRGRWA